ncbi:MAG: D-glycero-alpha-D-manno-heptose-1,7-bisphosphate 7-phosphatase [Pyrinomonadaceae bacterium]
MISEATKKKPAIFVDRDGTLIEEVNFLSRVEDLRIFEFTAQALRLLKDQGFLVVVVTNQSGIGRRIYDEAAMNSIHASIQKQLGGAIDAFYFCPHLPCDGCECRKPGLGMILSACADHEIDLTNSWMVGDKAIDMQTGVNAGIRTAMVMTGYGRQHVGDLEFEPDVRGENLLEVSRRIAEQPQRIASDLSPVREFEV